MGLLRGTQRARTRAPIRIRADQFRLWIAIHECTHRAQFTGVPWLRPYFLSLVNGLIDSVDPDPERVFATIRATIEDRKARRSDPDAEGALDGGIARLLASPEQKLVLDQVTGLMSLLEGHGDVTMDRAGRRLIPSQPRFARVLAERRANASGPAKFFQKLLGFEAKLAQYAEGEAFITAVETAGGQAVRSGCGSGPRTCRPSTRFATPKSGSVG